MRIFITGGNGFIGSHLVQNLLQQNHSVTVYDILKSDSLNSNPKKVNQIIGDIRDFDTVVNSINGHDCTIHLAAKISVQESLNNPSETFDVNVDGTKNLLEACKQVGISKFIAASTAAVYGKTDDLPISEVRPLLPISPYGQSKMEMEKLVHSYSVNYNFNSIILRPFNVYGKGQSKEYAGVISRFIENIYQNKPLEIYGDGSFTRDFVFIDDVVHAFDLAISHILGKRAEIYNIASGTQTSIDSIAKMLLNLSGNKVTIIHKPTKQGDIPHSEADITKAKMDLGYSPNTVLEDGLKLFLDSIESNFTQ